MSDTRHRQKLITTSEAEGFVDALYRCPVHVEPAMRLLKPAFQIAISYDRAVYDALFVALVQDVGLRGVTADEPLYNSIHPHFPQVVLLRDW